MCDKMWCVYATSDGFLISLAMASPRSWRFWEEMNETIQQDINGEEWYNKISKLCKECVWYVEVRVRHPFDIVYLCCIFWLENLSKMIHGFEQENLSK